MNQRILAIGVFKRQNGRMGRSTVLTAGVYLALGAGIFAFVFFNGNRRTDNGSGQSNEIERAPDARKYRVHGTVKLIGSPPLAKPIDTSGESSVVLKNQLFNESILVSNENLKNVLVYAIRHGETLSSPHPLNEAEIVVKDLQIVPRISVLRIGQRLKFSNLDSCSHNVRYSSNERPTGFQEPQGIDALQTGKRFEKFEVGIPVRCDIHKWMKAWIHVLPHDFYSLSTSEGTYSISDLPPGDYDFVAWHESPLLDGPPIKHVTLGGQQDTVSLDFEFKVRLQE